MAKQSKSKRLKDVELKRIMEHMREEVARECGLPSAFDAQLGDVSSKLCGTFGHMLYQRAAELLPDSDERSSE